MLSPRPAALPNRTGTCFINATIQTLFSSTRLIAQVRALGTRTLLTAQLNAVLTAYCAGSVTEAVLNPLCKTLRELHPPGDLARAHGGGGDSTHTFQLLANELNTLDRTFNNQMIYLGLPDQSSTPITMSQLLTLYNHYLATLEARRTKMYMNGTLMRAIDARQSVLAFCITRPLPGHAINPKPVVLEPEITVGGARFRLTGCAMVVPGHAFAQKQSVAGWFRCDDTKINNITDAVANGPNSQAYLVIYERI